MALLAQITSYPATRDNRRASRRILRLRVPAIASGDATEALVHNISRRGLLVETEVFLEVGDVLVVELPQAGTTKAKVVWTDDGFAGCRFDEPISTAVISAGLLKSAQETPPYYIAPSQPPGVSTDSNYEPLEFTEEGPWVRTLMVVSLLLALVAATIFIVALLSFPFANY